MPSINWTVTSSYDEGRYQTLLWLEEGGKPRLTPYKDSKGIPTIGIGVALPVPDNLKSVLGYVDPTGFLASNYLAQFTALGNQRWTAGGLYAPTPAFDRVEAQAYAASGGTVPKTFAIPDAAMRPLFTYIVQDRPGTNYEKQLADRLPGIALGDTREHAALLDMTYNAPSLVGKGIATAIGNGDRAEVFYEIRYRSFGNVAPNEQDGVAARRYAEAQVWGLYSDPGKVGVDEAKLAVRMGDNHTTQIDTYDKAHIRSGNVLANANNNVKGIAGATDFRIDPVYESMKDALKPATDRLVRTYVELDGDLATVQAALREAEYEGNLLDLKVRTVHVAATGGLGSASPAGTANYAASKENLLLIGAPSKDVVGDGGYDTVLKGGSGDDWFVGGAGKDAIDGGGGSNTVSYLDSKLSVTIDLEAGTASGGDADGDTLKGIENIFGSRQADRITGSSEDDVIYGAGGGDTIDGRAGDDVIVAGGKGGPGATLRGGGGKDVVYGGDGDDRIHGDAGEDRLHGGKGDDRIYGGDGEANESDKDTFWGDAGNDEFHAGDGDVIKDPEPGDRLYVDEHATAGVAKRQQGSTGAYRNSEGMTFQWKDGALLVTDGKGEGSTVRVENFHDGDLGITLREVPKAPDDPDTTGSLKASPLVLDLDGDGSYSIGLPSSHAYFDQDNDGFAELTGWISRTDGFLALDGDGDGVVGNRSELFGYATYDIAGRFHADGGFARLASYDLNQDGAIDASDDVFGKLAVWIDADGNGVSTKAEMHGLAELGIASISVVTAAMPLAGASTGNGNYVSDLGTFAWTDGRSGGVADVWFAYDSASTQAAPTRPAPAIDPTLSGLPDLPGSGKVQGLHAAMSADPVLRAMVERLAAAGPGDIAHLSQDIEAIAFRWMGAADLDPSSRGPYANGQSLGALERWFGRDFLQGGNEANPRPQASAVLLQAWQGLLGELSTQLLVQTDLGHALLPGTTFEGGAFVVTPDGFETLSLVESLAAHAPTAPADALAYWTSALPVIGYLGTGHSMAGVAAAFDAAMARSGIPLTFAEVDPTDPARFTVVAKPEGGTLLGRQVDAYTAGLVQGNDILVAGRGDDLMMGRAGSDTYLETGKGGRDTITESINANDQDDPYAWIGDGDANVIRFVDGTRAGDLSYAIVGTDLVVTVAGEGGTVIRVTGFFGERAGSIASIAFADGSAISGAEIAASLSVPTEGDDVLYVFGDATVDGLGGNDDILDGPGSQTFAFGYGSGHDRVVSQGDSAFWGESAHRPNTVAFKAGIAAGDLSFRREGSALVISLPGDHDSLALTDWFPSRGAATTRFAFADGTAITPAEIVARLARTTDGDDHAYGDDGAPATFDGGKGDDVLEGGSAYDTYVFGRGYGHDVVRESDGPYGNTGNALVVRDGIALADLAFTRGGRDQADLVISIVGTGDSLVVERGLASPIVTQFRIDGQRLSLDDIRLLVEVPQGTPGDDLILGTPGADTLDGGAGDDVLQGDAGDDTYVFGGGYGHDTVTDFSGRDTILFKPGIRLADLAFSRDSRDDIGLRITLPTGDDIRVDGFFMNAQPILRLADGTTLSADDVRAAMLSGSAAPETIHGFTDRPSVIDGKGGDDTVFAGPDDTVLFGPGSGHDTLHGDARIRMADGIRPGDVLFANDGERLTATLATGESISIDMPGAGPILDGVGPGSATVAFADGTVLDADDMIALAAAQARTDGNDVIHAGPRGGTLDGGKGDDRLVAAGFGVPVTYVVGRDYGHDVAVASYANPSIRAIDGLVASDMAYSHAGDNLIVSGGGSVLELEGFFRSNGGGLTVTFDDGTVVSGDAIIDDVLSRVTDGDDLVRVGAGVVADGGKGNDTYIPAGPGGTYVFGRGSGHDFIDAGRAGLSPYDAGGFHILIQDGTAAADLTFSYSSTGVGYGQRATMTIGIRGADDTLTVPLNSVADISFRDGPALSARDVATLLTASDIGPAGGLVRGSSYDETIRGGSGDDILFGNGGTDTYVVGKDDGSDRVAEFGTTGIVSLVDAARDGVRFGFGAPGPNKDDLVIHVLATGQTVTVGGMAQSFGWGRPPVAEFRFADGTVMDAAAAMRAALAEGATTGDDYLLGTPGEDAMDGGRGDDLVDGADGFDTYAFGRGSGHDTIQDTGRTDGLPDGAAANAVRLKAGIAASDLSFSHAGPDYLDLLASVRDTTDTLVVRGFFRSDRAPVAEFRFADGSILDAATLAETLRKPTDGADTLVGGDGADTLDGGKGDDVLVGRDGPDAYVFGKGYGHDTVVERGYANFQVPGDDTVILRDLSLADVVLVRSGTNLDDLVIRSKLGDDVLTVSRFFTPVESPLYGDKVWGIEGFAFGDGATLTRAQVAALATAVDTSGDNVVSTGPSGGTLSAGAGTNALNGGKGDDTYEIGFAGNVDTIDDLGGTDLVRLGPGIKASDVGFTLAKDAQGRPYDLLVQVDSGPGLTFRVVGQFAPAPTGRIESIALSDGSSIGWRDMARQAYEGLATQGADVISYADSGLGGARIEGLRGADAITGTAFADTYVWSRGDGDDVVSDAPAARGAPVDTLVLHGISRDDVSFARVGDDLRVNVSATGEAITVKGQFAATPTGIARVLLDDGTAVAAADLIAPAIRGDGRSAIVGTANVDAILGTDASETIDGAGGGNAALGTGDLIDAGGGDDVLRGGAGADTLLGGSGNDILFAGRADIARGGTGDDVVVLAGGAPAAVDGGEGFDILRAGPGPDARASLAGTTVSGIERVEVMDGASLDLSGARVDGGAGLGIVLRSLSGGRAEVAGTAGSDRIVGGAGVETIHGSLGDDTVIAGDGGATIDYATGADAARPQSLDIRGGTGDDTVSAVLDGRADRLVGGGGSDRLILRVGTGFGGPLDLDLSAPVSTLSDGTRIGGFEALSFTGGDAPSRIVGGAGADILVGGKGDDAFSGGTGDDRLDGAMGHDRLLGGAGSDTFVLHASGGVAEILDFTPGSDRLELSGFHVDEIVSGASPLGHGRAGVPTLFYVTGTGDLWFAADGTGAPTLIAHLSGAPALRPEDVRDGSGTAPAGIVDAPVPAPVAPGILPGTDRSWSPGDGAVAFDMVAASEAALADGAPTRDTLRLHGVSPADLTVSRDASDPDTMTLDFPGGRVVLTGQMAEGAPAHVGTVRFDDGTTLDAARLAALADAASPRSVSAPDALGFYGDPSATVAQAIETGSGDDLVLTGLRSDVVTWGTGHGDDVLSPLLAPTGSHNARAGTIVLRGLDADDVKLLVVTTAYDDRPGSSLAIRIRATGETLTVLGQFAGATSYAAGTTPRPGLDAVDSRGGEGAVEFLRFADGTEWDAAAILAHARYGDAGSGLVDGTRGLATLPALSGAAGGSLLLGRHDLPDTYVHDIADGNDIVVDPAGASSVADTLRLTGVAPGAVEGWIEGTDVVLRAGSGSVRLVGEAAGDGAGVERVAFDDGTVWDRARLMALGTRGTDADDAVRMVRDGTVDAGKGDDLVVVTAATVTVRHALGEGHDTIRAAEGFPGSRTLDLAGIDRAGAILSRVPAAGDPDGPPDDLLVTDAAGGSVRVEGQFSGHGVGRIAFADGTILDAAALSALLPNAPAPVAVHASAEADATAVSLSRADLLAGFAAGSVLSGVADAVGGHAALGPDGIAFSREDAGGFEGLRYVTYTVTDPSGHASTNRAYVDFASTRPPLAAVGDADATDAGTALVRAADAGVLANDAGLGTLAVADAGDGGVRPGAPAQGAYGILVLSADGSYAYTPTSGAAALARGETRVDAFTYAVTDAGSRTATAVLSISVTGTNHAPTAAPAPATAHGPQDAVLSGTLAAGLDADGDAIRYVLLEGSASHGTVSLDTATGRYAFTPDAGHVGAASFSYVVTDGSLTSAPRSVPLAFDHVNHGPAAATGPETAHGPQDAVLRGTLAAGTDPDGDGLTYVLVAGSATGGVATVAADGTYAFTPDPGHVGPASFSYVVSDGSLSSDPKAVTLAFDRVNHAPVAGTGSESARGPQDAVLRGTLLAGSDPDGDALVHVLVEGSARRGTVTVAADGTFAFAPETGYVGEAGFSYVVVDAGGARSAAKAVGLSFERVNHAPAAAEAAESATGPQDAILRGVLARGTDPDGDALAYAVVRGSEVGGTVSLAADGTFAFTPDAGHVGAAGFSYTVSDGSLHSAPKAVSLAFEHVNHAPAAALAGETIHGIRDAALSGQLPAGTDPDGDRLTYSLVAGSASHGVAAITPAGTFLFVPEPGYAGPASFAYVVWDGSLASAPRTVALAFDAVNRAPVAAASAETGTGPQDAPLRGHVLPASDPDGDALSYAVVAGSARHGAVSMTPDGAYVFTPEPGYVGEASFAYRAGDGSLASDAKTVSLTLTHVNHAPVAASVAEAAHGPRDAVLRGHLLPGMDPDGDTLHYRAVEGSAVHGKVAVGPDGTFAFTPEAGYEGLAGFSYVVDDGHLASAAKEVSLTLDHVNHAPTAADDALGTVKAGSTATFAPGALLGNDRDADGDTLSVSGLRDVVGGSATLGADGSVTFAAAAGHKGTAGFAYDVSDGHGGVATAHASLVVEPSAHAIVARPGQLMVVGTRGDDEIHLTPGVPLAIGNGGSDTFVLPPRFGAVVIADFDAASGPGHDVLDVSAMGLHDMAEVRAAMRTGSTFGIPFTVIEAPGHGSVLLANVRGASLTHDDFHFA